MNDFTLPLYCVVLALTVAAMCSELWRDLMMFQQNSYRPERYRRWLSESGDTTSGWRLFGLIVLFFCMSPFLTQYVADGFTGIFSCLLGLSLVRRKYKKPLVMTRRAARIYITALFLSILVAGICCVLFAHGALTAWLFAATMGFLACYCASHVLIVAANWLLKPIEKKITRGYIAEAEAILADMPNLKIVGITGSYGKTTTKHYLQRILSQQYETLMTPGSYNTTLGVVRTIREMLRPYHEVFIVEMGAKQPDDIAEICRLVHPQNGIITAVGPQHLESFKTIETVQATKFELADALPANGLIVINNDFEMIANRPVDNCRCLRYAVSHPEGADYVAEDIAYSPAGTIFTVRRTSDGHSMRLSTRLVGECNISNILAAVVMALDMGVSEEKIAFAVAQIEQVEHRMSIKRIPGGLTIIDDAFNSNPVGSAMALDVLASMPGKRILITPGMIELGERQYELNAAFGRKAAQCCDVAIVVGEYNRNAITDGLRGGGFEGEPIHTPDTFAEAQQILARIAAAGDAVLYENDLPDTFK